MLADVRPGAVDDADAGKAAGVGEGELDGGIRVCFELELPEAGRPLTLFAWLDLVIVALVRGLFVLDVYPSWRGNG